LLAGKRVLLIVTGGIAAYKCPDLVRRLTMAGAQVHCVLTKGGAQFVTPLTLSALSGEKTYEQLFSLTDESEMGHIRLARQADLCIVAPASADFLAKMANGLADDLASTLLLATNSDILVAPAMNTAMWTHPATRDNMTRLLKRGVKTVGPGEGDLACGETGEGRMAEPAEILAAIETYFSHDAPLSGRRAVVTSGPTHEAIDPVRYIANRSSGRQGHAIADALARLGAQTILVSGPTQEPDPAGIEIIRVESARDMLAAVTTALPADIAVCAAAVADWRISDVSAAKIKKTGGVPPKLELSENPDILATLGKAGNLRPGLLIGFAAETESDPEKMVKIATAKRTAKGCDWILANDVSPHTGTFGGLENAVHLIDGKKVEAWEKASKEDIARQLAARIAAHFAVAA
jgi:phosphopantothenoylcysteine decarboxylase / phosphopantothenate---cysteine ligase